MQYAAALMTPLSAQNAAATRPVPHVAHTPVFVDAGYAVAELGRRRSDAALAARTHAGMRDPSGEILARCTQPTAVLFRQLATPTHEILRFLDTVRVLGLRPLILEYSGDKFVGAGNPYKRSLGKMPLFGGVGSDGRDIVRFKTVVDFNAANGKALADIRLTDDSTSLIEFHHDLFKRVTGLSPQDACYDATAWFHAHGGQAAQYYEPFLSFFVRDAILFENFMLNEHEELLTTQIVGPAFERVTERLGHYPLIVQLVPTADEQRPYWDEYPPHVSELLGA